MPSNSVRGNYYKLKTKRWLEGRGYAVAVMERMYGVAPGRFVKVDQMGSDLLAVSTAEVLFVQVKMGGRTWRKRGWLSDATKAFDPFPVPPHGEQQVVVWEPGAREPLVYRRLAGESAWRKPPDDRLPLRAVR